MTSLTFGKKNYQSYWNSTILYSESIKPTELYYLHHITCKSVCKHILKHVFITFVAGGFCGKDMAATMFIEVVDKLFNSTAWSSCCLREGSFAHFAPVLLTLEHWNKAGMVISIIQSDCMPVWNNLALTGWIFMKSEESQGCEDLNAPECCIISTYPAAWISLLAKRL